MLLLQAHQTLISSATFDFNVDITLSAHLAGVKDLCSIAKHSSA